MWGHMATAGEGHQTSHRCIFSAEGLGALFYRGKTPPPVIFGLEVSPHLPSVAQVSPIYPQALPPLLPPASPLDKVEAGVGGEGFAKQKSTPTPT